MFAATSGHAHAPQRSLTSVIGHAVLIGAAAAILQMLAVVALLYASGILES
ncbi:MAG: hypothetical protein AB7S71_24400 [Dongiaceae bacterium]